MRTVPTWLTSCLHSATEMPIVDVTMDGVRRHTAIVNKVPALNEKGEMSEDPDDLESLHVNSTNIGPGQTIQRISRAFEVVMMGTVTPIDDQSILLRFNFTLPKDQTGGEKFFAEATRDNIAFGVTQDIPIWNHKRYVDDPALCDGDEPIAKYRKWFSQFYVS